jgi:alkanesulfonate monooxygenase SsuD/methylene tetrahydromethanopterin reductase-like flavin-dependent oxidoreductase (luciferase family)
MKFALFYEIPLAQPWAADSEHRAFKNTLEQAVLGEQAGFDSFWSVEHHFLDEYSHGSNPEVLYGAIAAKTSRMRIGSGVRLGPKPYNHPVRSAESAAVLDLISDGRVEFGTGRSSTRIEMEGFGVHPNDTREMWLEAVGHIVHCWTHDAAEFSGKHWQLPPRRVRNVGARRARGSTRRGDGRTDLDDEAPERDTRTEHRRWRSNTQRS